MMAAVHGELLPVSFVCTLLHQSANTVQVHSGVLKPAIHTHTHAFFSNSPAVYMTQLKHGRTRCI